MIVNLPVFLAYLFILLIIEHESDQLTYSHCGWGRERLLYERAFCAFNLTIVKTSDWT